MADIKNYSYSPPSFGTSTPGANYKPGETFRALSRDIGSVRQQVAETAKSKAQVLLGPLENQGYNIGSLIGRTFGEVQKAKAAQTQQQGDVDNATRLFDARKKIDDKRAELQTTKANDPQAAHDELMGYAKDVIDGHEALSRLAFPKDPQIANKFHEKGYAELNSLEDKSSSWVLSQRKANDDNSAKVIANEPGDSIAKKPPGTPVESLIADHLRAQARADSALEGMRGSLGSKVDILKRNMTLYGNASLMHRVMADKPTNPETALTKSIPAAQDLLETLSLPPQTRLQLQAGIQAWQAKATKGMVDQIEADRPQRDVDVKTFRLKIDKSFDDPTIQQSAIDFAGKQMQTLQTQINIVQKNPKYPPEVKQAVTEAYTKQIGEYDQLTRAATAHIEKHQNKVEQHQREALAEQRRQNSASEKYFKAQLNAQKAAETWDARVEMNAIRKEMLSVNPDDHETMGRLGRQLNDKTNEMINKHQLTPEHGLSVMKDAAIISSNAAKTSQRQLNAFEALGNDHPDAKVIQQQKVINASTAAKQEMLQAVNRQTFAQQQDAINALYGKAWMGQMDVEFQAGMSAIQARAEKEKWSHLALQKKVNQLRNQIWQDHTIQLPPAQVAKQETYLETLSKEALKQLTPDLSAKHVGSEVGKALNTGLNAPIKYAQHEAGKATHAIHEAALQSDSEFIKNAVKAVD